MDSDLPAEVTFGAMARGALRTPAAGLKPKWDPTSYRCSSVYCHALSGAKTPAPTWTAPGTSQCTSCHGVPPTTTLSGTSHPQSTLDTCHTCHKGVVDKAGKIIDRKKHLNGKTDFL